MIRMNYYNNKKFGLLQFHSGFGKFYLNSPKGYSQKISNAQTGTWADDVLQEALLQPLEGQCGMDITWLQEGDLDALSFMPILWQYNSYLFIWVVL